MDDALLCSEIVVSVLCNQTGDWVECVSCNLSILLTKGSCHILLWDFG